jgi:hypothetical protein
VRRPLIVQRIWRYATTEVMRILGGVARKD